MARRVAPLMLLLYLAVADVIADVSVTGLENEAKENVRLMLSLEKEKCASPEWKIRDLFGKADVEINQALGYYHSVIKKSLAFNVGCWQAGFTVNSGPRVIVDDVAVAQTGASQKIKLNYEFDTD
ncbi:MAG: hypothetical protein M0Q44_17310 [Methylobacter sp.]|nr:hypothetical protein [Methylobacter sp.]